LSGVGNIFCKNRQAIIEPCNPRDQKPRETLYLFERKTEANIIWIEFLKKIKIWIEFKLFSRQKSMKNNNDRV